MADPHHADEANAYVRGDMAIKEQISTFRLFLNLAKWGSLAVACLVLMLTLWFHPGRRLRRGASGRSGPGRGRIFRPAIQAPRSLSPGAMRPSKAVAGP
ncbi:aa3-type cytochrome c oxidase subunit IV [Brevundimonas sp. SORGH_AS_0993]|uniref:aa3-type cytochrome c oxidase subunit IV n=1 Tax=Brevundimonas sp. SORGH_AS_0993 TaxID=3041794 RepID=UPI0027812B31|nr:aa3-type cytochrome c oxidase subunit IV [Brevundimonas sp. SORGH_AS_0993]MDQ1152916.1 hypothetical protein [Brevundimonas sp. SORGH_AS_0993]